MLCILFRCNHRFQVGYNSAVVMFSLTYYSSHKTIYIYLNVVENYVSPPPTFPNKFMGKARQISWPSRSPDFFQLDV